VAAAALQDPPAGDQLHDEPLPDLERRGLLRAPSARAIGLAGAVVALGTVTLASVAFGARPSTVGTVLDALFAYDPSIDDHLVVRGLRLPRTVVGLLVGLALGLAGAVMQGVARNPLADPGILGVSAGASLFVVLAIYWFGVGSLTGYVWFAFAGAAVAAVFVYGVGSVGREGATPVKLALAGAAVSALLASVTTAILLIDLATLDQFRFWAVGSLAGRDAVIAWQIAPFVLVGTVMAMASGRILNALALGDDVARSLGQRVGTARAFAATAVVLLVGVATAAAGPIGFVGLTVPHVARAITGPDYRWVLPYSAVLAPTLLLGSDVVGRLVARPGEVQVGIVTALVGAPFFVALVRRRKMAEL
jgi:iron complex transport system permease protein